MHNFFLFWWLPILSFVTCAFVVISKKTLWNLRTWKFTPMFSSKSFYNFSSCINIYHPYCTNFGVCYNVVIYIQSLASGYPIVPSLLVLKWFFPKNKKIKWFFPPLNCLITFVKNPLTLYVIVYFWTKFFSIDLYVFMAVPFCLFFFNLFLLKYSWIPMC